MVIIQRPVTKHAQWPKRVVLPLSNFGWKTLDGFFSKVVDALLKWLVTQPKIVTWQAKRTSTEEPVMQSHIHCVTSARVAIVSGTSSWSLSSIAVAPSKIKFCSMSS